MRFNILVDWWHELIGGVVVWFTLAFCFGYVSVVGKPEGLLFFRGIFRSIVVCAA